MCRLSYLPAGRKPAFLTDWLTQMEKSCGGDGTGIASGKQMVKAAALTAVASVKLIAETDQPVLWHTRKVSSGAKCDRLCHPFPCDGGFLAHNGHWHEASTAAKMMSDLDLIEAPASDTYVFSLLVSKLGFSAATDRWQPAGVWLWMDHTGKLSVWKNGGSLWYHKRLKIWGSEPPARHGKDWIEVVNGYYEPGERPREKKRVTFVSNPQFLFEKVR